MADDTGPKAERPDTSPDGPPSDVEEGYVELDDDAVVLSDEDIAAAAAFLASVGEDREGAPSDSAVAAVDAPSGQPRSEQAAPEKEAPKAPGGTKSRAEAPPPPEPPSEEPPEAPSVADAAADLIQTAIDFARQETEALIREKVVAPLQQLGLAVSSASAAGCLAVLGIGFLSVALLLVLAGWLGWPGALALIGGVLLVGSGVFTYVKVRSMQKDE